MAKDNKALDKAVEELQEGEEEQPKKKGGKGKFILILLILLLLGGGGGAWFMLKPKPQGKAEQPKVEQPKPIFTTLDQFTVNLQPEDGDHYLQVGIDLRVSDEKVIEEINLHMPEVKNSLLFILSSKHGSEISTMEGKQKLATEIQSQVNKILGSTEPASPVTGVFFTTFIIQ